MSTPRRSRRGNAALEAALATPLLCVMIFGIIDYTWYIMELETVVLAAQAGVRAGAQTKLSNGPATKARTVATSVLTANYPDGTPMSPTYTTTLTNNVLSITVACSYRPLIGLVPMPAQMQYKASMKLEDLS